jgi:hypothetical protein
MSRFSDNASVVPGSPMSNVKRRSSERRMALQVRGADARESDQEAVQGPHLS